MCRASFPCCFEWSVTTYVPSPHTLQTAEVLRTPQIAARELQRRLIHSNACWRCERRTSPSSRAKLYSSTSDSLLTAAIMCSRTNARAACATLSSTAYPPSRERILLSRACVRVRRGQEWSGHTSPCSRTIASSEALSFKTSTGHWVQQAIGSRWFTQY